MMGTIGLGFADMGCCGDGGNDNTWKCISFVDDMSVVVTPVPATTKQK